MRLMPEVSLVSPHTDAIKQTSRLSILLLHFISLRAFAAQGVYVSNENIYKSAIAYHQGLVLYDDVEWSAIYG